MSSTCRIGLAGLIVVAACGGGNGDDRPAPAASDAGAGAGATARADPPPAHAPPQAPDPHVDDPSRAGCPDPVLHYDHGAPRGWLCRDAARSLGLTLVDLSEAWAPLPFTPADHPPPRFRDTYLALAAERDPDGGELEAREKLVELYGVTPAPSIVLRRLSDDKRHACHAAIDNRALALVHRDLAEQPNQYVDFYERKRRGLYALLDRERKRRKLADVAALGKVHRWAHEVLAWQKLEHEHDALIAAQEHLVCDGLMSKKFVDGRLTWMTAAALELYQRSHFLLPDGELDADTRAALAVGELEHDFRAALRVLRERVVDATGLIEDGTAGAGPVPILGRQLEPETMRKAKGHGPLPGGAPDLIGPATEAAAIALGWTSPEAARAFLAEHKGERLIVALALPPPPPWHTEHMNDLHAVVDRGDVWYDLKPIHRTLQRRPAFILYAGDKPLVQWPTTIGGWQDENEAGGRIDKQWKESDVGPRMWRDLYVAPTWQPPKTTPDDDLLENQYNGHWRLKSEVLGPGPRSAYGMVMLINYKVEKSGKKVAWIDHGIRVHGSASVTSVVRGQSHGCHRLLNHLAVRLGSFLLRHHDHVVKGDQKTWYHRVVRAKNGERFTADVRTHGYLYQLTPPIPVDVTPGRIRSHRKIPPPHSSGATP